jgi:hypothetical protein
MMVPTGRGVWVPGRRRVAPALLEARAAACAACEYRRPDVDRCSLMSCGCALSTRRASAFATCPAGLWSDRCAHGAPTSA